MSRSTCSPRTVCALGAEAVVGDQHVGLAQGRDPAQAPHAPLRVVGDDDEPLGASDQRAVGLGLEQVRRREAGVLGHAVHAHEQHVDVQRAQRGQRDRPDERVRRRAHAAGQHDRQVGPRLRGAARSPTWIELVTTVRSGTSAGGGRAATSWCPR